MDSNTIVAISKQIFIILPNFSWGVSALLKKPLSGSQHLSTLSSGIKVAVLCDSDTEISPRRISDLLSSDKHLLRRRSGQVLW